MLRENSSGRQPDENYAREVMQLFTIGLNALNPDGTPKLDAENKPEESISQEDVTNLARVFTGYDWDYLSNGGSYVDLEWERNPVPSTHFATNPMHFNSYRHSRLDVNFLGTKITSTTPGQDALHIALDRLFYHDNTAPFFARQMIQRLVTSNPSPAYVQRVATVFGNNGSGVRGDLKAVWTAILTDEEARAMPTAADTFFGKLREPIVRLRALGAHRGGRVRKRRVPDRRSVEQRHHAQPEPAALAFGVQLLPARLHATQYRHRDRWQAGARVPAAPRIQHGGLHQLHARCDAQRY